MKEEGRIPFAYVFAIIFVLMLLLSGIYMAILNGHNDINVSKFYEEADTNLRHVDNMLEEKAYHTIMEVIHNVTKKRDPRIYEIQNYVFQNFSRFINDTFPFETQDYNVTIGNYSIKVVMDYKKAKEFIKGFKLSWIGFSNSIDNRLDGYMHNTMLPVYPYVVGFVNYTYHDKRTNYDMHRHLRFNKIIYSPLPLLKFAFDEFNTSTSNLGDFGRLIRYILTTLAEYRILQGYASGAYDGIEVPITQVLTKKDVEKAVNLALLLESVRYFRAYDKNMASSMGIDGIIKKYAVDGTIDAADIYFLWNKTNQNFSVGKVLGQSIYGYADRFVYELLMLFWGNPKNDYFADPTLKEPITNWTEIMNKNPSWRKKMLYVWLDKWRHWLNIPETLNPYMDSAEIKIDFDVWILIPNNPPYWIVVPATADMEWTVWTDGVSDTIDLILDNPRDEYYILNTQSISLDPQYPYSNSGTYTYDVVKKSLVEKHETYSSSGDKYYSTLKFIMDALTRAMKRRSSTYDDQENKGMLDYAAYDVSQNVGNKQKKIYGNPKDYNTILINGTKELIYNSSYKEGLDKFKQIEQNNKENWWRDGAYKQYKDNDEHDAYLYYLCKDTVDLWYESMKNLYDGGDPDPSDDAGPYDSDCESYPPSFQNSTWPYGYSGWPFYGADHRGSFNFHRDLNRDAYNNIKALMWVITWILVAQYGGIDGFPSYDSQTVWEDVKQQTENARQNVVGDNGLITDLNIHFPISLPYNGQYFSNLRDFLDYITEMGAYDTNFYDFVKYYVGTRIIGDGKLMDNMTYWLPESFDSLYKNVVMNANYTSIPLFLSMNQSRRIFWETSYKWDNYTERLKNETMVVDFIPDYLQDGQNINITIETPQLGHRFSDVQDVEEYNDGNSYNLSKAPFAYQFRVKIQGEFDMNLRTNRTSLVYDGRHWYTWYNDSVHLNLDLKIPVYTAWFLESHWNDCTSQDNWAFHTDVPFNYTRGYFKMDINPSESKDSPFFISKPLNMFIGDYENLGEIWNRYSTYYHYAMANMRDEMASWNFTYKNIVLNATNVTNNAMKNSDNQFATVGNELNEIFTVQNYLNKLSFFYFERNFNITQSNVDENNGYQKYSTDVGGKAVYENYKEGKTRFYANLTHNEITVNQKENYDGIKINSFIKRENIHLNWLSFHDETKKKLKIFAEATHDVWILDFGLVGDGNVQSLSKYLPEEIKNAVNNVTQEQLIKGLHHMLKDIYINETINYRLGLFIRIYAGSESYKYITWFNSTPTTKDFLIWLNNEIRSIVYKVGISEFPQHGYDEIRLNDVYYTINNLWMNLSYESSSIFGFKMRGDFRGYNEGYVINMHYGINVPTPNSGHGNSAGTGGGGSGGGSGGGGGGNGTKDFGIDVSHWQGDIDWNAVRNDGYVFAFVKATEGTSYVDSKFSQNVNNGNSAGLYIGAYHFAHPDSNNATAEADHFVDTILPYLQNGKLKLKPALDLETGSSLGKDKLSKWVNEFMNRVKARTGISPIIYTNSNYANHYLDSSVTQWDLWIAHWTYDPNGTPDTGIWSTWKFWQYSDKGTVSGISGYVDLDVYNGNLKAMMISTF